MKIALLILSIVSDVAIAGVIILAFIYSWRNNKVLAHTRKMLDKVSSVANIDIRNGREWEWRYMLLRRVDYKEMVIKFWRPLDSFYDWKMTDEHCHMIMVNKPKVHDKPILSPFYQKRP